MSWDLKILHHVNYDWSHPLLDWLMPAVSALHAWMPLLVAIALLVLWRGGRQGRRLLLSVALAVALGDGVFSNTLKKAVGRVRPRDAMDGLIIREMYPARPDFMRLFHAPETRLSKARKQQRGSSFPSSHTVNMFALATVVASFYRGWGILLYGVATLVALSRLYVAAHWPSDLPPSIGLGLVAGLLSVWIVRRFLPARW